MEDQSVRRDPLRSKIMGSKKLNVNAMTIQGQGVPVEINVTQADLINVMVSRIEVSLEEEKRKLEKETDQVEKNQEALRKEYNKVHEEMSKSHNKIFDDLATALKKAAGDHADKVERVSSSPSNYGNPKGFVRVNHSIIFKPIKKFEDIGAQKIQFQSDVPLDPRLKDIEGKQDEANKQHQKLEKEITEIEYRMKKLPMIERHIKASVTEKIISQPHGTQIDAKAFIESLNFNQLVSQASKAIKSIEAAKEPSNKRRR